MASNRTFWRLLWWLDGHSFALCTELSNTVYKIPPRLGVWGMPEIHLSYEFRCQSFPDLLHYVHVNKARSESGTGILKHSWLQVFKMRRTQTALKVSGWRDTEKVLEPDSTIILGCGFKDQSSGMAGWPTTIRASGTPRVERGHTFTCGLDHVSHGSYEHGLIQIQVKKYKYYILYKI